jgi:hypothetical protein
MGRARHQASHGPWSKSNSNRTISPASRTPEIDSTPVFLLKLVGGSTLGGAIVKYGSLYIDVPFEPSNGFAVALVVIPVLVYCSVLLQRR